MKKFMSVLITLAILLSVCGCGQETQTATTEPAETTEATQPTQSAAANHGEPTAEQMYGHINQLEPVDGVYKIWNAEGVKNIANHPDAKFELLCTVDMQGAVLAPIGTEAKPFTGELKGGNFFIRNFTVQGGEEENFGFIGVNQGVVRNLVLENVTFIPGSNAKNIGALCGNNQGKLIRCTINSSAMTVENAPDGANCGAVVGINGGELQNTVVTVDLAYNAQGAANVGGIAGTAQGGTIEFVDTCGKLDIAGTNKTYGLFAGVAADAKFQSCAFMGATNFAGGARFVNFTGTEDDEMTVVLKSVWRDNDNQAPIGENQQKLRDRVEQEMYAMGSVQWHANDLRHSCTCQLSGCHGIYNKEYTYIGIPYNHKGGSLARFLYCMDENGNVKDFVYEMADFDGYDAYIGNDCSTAIAQAWWSVSNSTDIIRCTYMLPIYDKGCLAVGDYSYDVAMTLSDWTEKIINVNDEQTMYESYGQLRKGDAYVYIYDVGGHTRMAAQDAVVVRNQDGTINPEYSYVLCHEQGASSTDEILKTTTSWRLYWKYTFANLYNKWCIPVTIEELLTGEMEPVEVTLSDSVSGRLGMTTGTIQANYFLDSVMLKVTDDQGNLVLDHRMFTSVGRYYDHNFNDAIIRNYVDSYDMGHFASILQTVTFQSGRTYTYEISAEVSTDDVVLLKTDSFVYGES